MWNRRVDRCASNDARADEVIAYLDRIGAMAGLPPLRVAARGPVAVVVHMKTPDAIALVWVAGGALLVAMLVDTLAMLGRQLHGRCWVRSSSCRPRCCSARAGALLLATRWSSRMRACTCCWIACRSAGRRCCRALHALFALIVLRRPAGRQSAWIALDLWHGHEESELLRMPYRPLRMLVVLVLVALLLDARAADRAEGARMSGPDARHRWACSCCWCCWWRARPSAWRWGWSAWAAWC